MSFSSPHQIKLVPAHGKAIVYEFRVPGGQIAYITSMANIFCLDTYYIIKIDGEPLQDKIEYEIASINDPKKLSEYIIAKKKIEVIGYNNSDVDLYMEMLIDGFFKPKEV